MLKNIFLTAFALALTCAANAQPGIQLSDSRQEIRRYPNQSHKFTSDAKVIATSCYNNEY